jgi:antitoxin component YwqK of YwqJK toxin-antitoxin module
MADNPITSQPPSDGQWLKHDEAGTLRQQATIQQGSLHGPLTLYDAHARVSLQESHVHGKLEGVRNIFVAGRLHTIANYRNGLQHGETLLHHKNGVPAAQLPYVDGLLHGEAVHYTEDGRPAKRMIYADGKLHGESSTFYPSGAILASEPYANDLLHGESKWFSPDGTITKRALYAEGKQLAPPPAAAPKAAPSLTPPPLQKRR